MEEEKINFDLKVLFWNVRSYNARKEEIEQKIHKVDILICVESRLKENQLPTTKKKPEIFPEFPGFKTFRQDRSYGDHPGGGILVFIRENIGYVELSHLKFPHEFVEISGFKITNTDPNISIIICYRAKGKLTQDQWNELMENANLDNNSLIVGDFNSHNRI